MWKRKLRLRDTRLRSKFSEIERLVVMFSVTNVELDSFHFFIFFLVSQGEIVLVVFVSVEPCLDENQFSGLSSKQITLNYLVF